MSDIRWTSIGDNDWTGAGRIPSKSSKFKATYTKSMELLRAELRRLGARQVSIAMDIGVGDLRRDGQMRADVRPATSRVLLTLERRIDGAWRQLRFPCWSYLSWMENLHAIALTLEALRSIDRYGATEKDQQWKGFAALGSGEDGPRAVNTQALALSPERSARILVEAHPTMGASAGGMGIEVLAKAMLDRSASAGMMKLAQESRMHAHPDKGGSDGLFATVNAAFEILQAYHRSGS